MSIDAIDGGKPTRPDVDALIEAFGDPPDAGRIITHEEIEGVIGHRYRSYRYGSVMSAWRKRLFTQHGTVMDGRQHPGEGLLVLPPQEVVTGWSHRQTRSVQRQMSKVVRGVSMQDESKLDAVGITQRNHVQLHLGTALSSIQGARRAIAAKPPSPNTPLPRGRS